MCPTAAAFLSNDRDLLAGVFDALPLPTLVVDRDVHVIEFNVAAARMLERGPFAALRPRCVDSAAGCGHAETCQDCVIYRCVHEALASQHTCRKAGRLHLADAAVDVVVTAAPVPDEHEPLVVLVLDDAVELAQALANPVSFSPDSTDRAKARGRKTDSSSSPRSCAVPRRKRKNTRYRSR